MKMQSHPNIAYFNLAIETDDLIIYIWEFCGEGNNHEFVKIKLYRLMAEDDGKRIKKKLMSVLMFLHNNLERVNYIEREHIKQKNREY